QTLAAQEAPARIVRCGPCRPAGRDAAGCRLATQPARTARPGFTRRRCRPGTPSQATTPYARPAAGRSAARGGRRHPLGTGALFPLRPAADRDHGRLDVRVADRRLDRPAKSAPGLTVGRVTGFPRVCKKGDRVTVLAQDANNLPGEIGRASCREREEEDEL